MPLYQIWYRENVEPIGITSLGRLSDNNIVSMILKHESIVPMLVTEENSDQAGDVVPSLSEIIQRYKLAPVRYTMDESEMIAIK